MRRDFILLCLCFFLDIFNRTFMSLLRLCGFHGYLHCFVLIIFISELDALRQFFLFFFSAFYFFYFIFFFLVLNFQVCIKYFPVFLFFNRTKRGKCAFSPQKYTQLRLHLRKCSCFSRHDRLYRTCVLTGHRIQASQTGRTKHLGSVNGSSRL